MKDFALNLKLVLGVVMIGLGGYVALRPLMPNNAALTGTRWLDMAFAAMFLLRGVMNVRGVMRTRRSRVG